MGSLVPVDHDPFAPTPSGMQLNAQPGASSFTDIANSGYANNADRKAMLYDVALSGGKGLATIINQSPAHEGAKSYQKKVGEEAAALEERQRAGALVLGQLHDLRDLSLDYQKNKPDAFKGAIGPYNTTPYMEKMPLIGGMTAPKAAASYPGAASFIPGSPDPKAWDVQNRLQHMIHGLTTSFVASAGKGGVNMSDSRQKVFEETMGAMMQATSPEEFNKITHDAAEIIRKTFNLPPGDAQHAAEGLGKQVQAAAASGGLGGMRGQSAGGIPQGAIDLLKSNKSRQMREFVDSQHDYGESDRILRGN